MKMKRWLTSLVAALLLLSFLASCGGPVTPDNGEDEPPEQNEEEVTYANLTYELDGGNLPAGEWDKYANNADFDLPVPTKKNHAFGGWYLTNEYALDGYLTKIPAGQTSDYKLYAKWYKLALNQSAKDLNSELTLDGFNGSADNSVEVKNGVYVWKQGTTSASKLIYNDSLPTLLNGEKQFTVALDLSMDGSAPCFSSSFKIGGDDNAITIAKFDKSGNVSIGTKKVATLSKAVQRISFYVDLEAGTVAAYDLNGKLLNEVKIEAPSGKTMAEFYDDLKAICWEWSASVPSALSIINIAGVSIMNGNSAPRGDGMPVTISAKGSASQYRIVYEADSDIALNAADKLLLMLAQKEIPSLEKVSDASPAKVKEIVIGRTDRDGTDEVIKPISSVIDEYDDNGMAWAIGFVSGKLYVVGSSEYSYTAALKYIEDNFLTDDKLVVPAEFMGYKSMTDLEILCESLIVDELHDTYMSYDVYDNFYEGYTDPYNMSEGDYKAMTVTRVSATTYTIKYVDEKGGIFSADLVQKKWGVWNMGATSYTEPGGTVHNMTFSSTDYEFVLRVNGKGSSGLKSGNHGDYPKDNSWAPYIDPVTGKEDPTSYYNDMLLDITFYDGKTGNKLNLDKTGDSVTTNGVRIVMHHNVYEFNYTKENVLINAERSYLYNGYEIHCDTRLYMTQDVRFTGITYSAMLPISKQYGNCAMFYCVDGTTVYMKTPLSNTVNETRMGQNATKIDIWGENNPKYHYTVTLNNPTHQLMSPKAGGGYTGLREMNGGTTNKLYCSLFSSTGSLQEGSELHFNTCWAFSVQEDFVNPDREPDYWVGVKK